MRGEVGGKEVSRDGKGREEEGSESGLGRGRGNNVRVGMGRGRLEKRVWVRHWGRIECWKGRLR